MNDAVKNRISELDFDALVTMEMRLAALSVDAKRIADESGLTRREIAALMGNASPSTLQRMLNGAAYNATLESVSRLAWACGHELCVKFVSRTGHSGDTANNIINFAEQVDPLRGGLSWSVQSAAAEPDQINDGFPWETANG